MVVSPCRTHGFDISSENAASIPNAVEKSSVATDFLSSIKHVTVSFASLESSAEVVSTYTVCLSTSRPYCADWPASITVVRITAPRFVVYKFRGGDALNAYLHHNGDMRPVTTPMLSTAMLHWLYCPHIDRYVEPIIFMRAWRQWSILK